MAGGASFGRNLVKSMTGFWHGRRAAGRGDARALCSLKVIAAIAMACLWIASSARADMLARGGKPRVLVIAAKAKPGSAEAELIDAVRAALADLPEVRLLPPSPLDLEAVQLSIDCTDESAQCFGEIATRMEAEIVVVPSLKRRADTLELRVECYERGASSGVVTAMRKQAGRQLDSTLLDAVPGMLREALKLESKEEPEPEPEPEPELARAELPRDSSPEPAAASVPRDDSAGGGLPLGPVLLGGGGLSLVVAGVVVGAMASATEDEYASRTIESAGQAERADALRERGKSEALAANVLLGTGAAAIVAAGVWYLLDMPAAEHAPAHARLTPVLGPSSAGVLFTGRFQAQP
jgi:hypothetical protein